MNKINNKPAWRKVYLGYTLIEALIVVAILGILAAIAIPSYQRSIMSGNRSVAQAGLLDLANRLEQFYLDNKTYTDDLTNLGFPAAMVFDSGGDSAIAVNNSQSVVGSASTNRIYVLKIDAAVANSFSVSAVPQLKQADDAECATLTLTNTGAKTISGTGPAIECW